MPSSQLLFNGFLIRKKFSTPWKEEKKLCVFGLLCVKATRALMQNRLFILNGLTAEPSNLGPQNFIGGLIGCQLLSVGLRGRTEKNLSEGGDWKLKNLN